MTRRSTACLFRCLSRMCVPYSMRTFTLFFFNAPAHTHIYTSLFARTLTCIYKPAHTHTHTHTHIHEKTHRDKQTDPHTVCRLLPEKKKQTNPHTHRSFIKNTQQKRPNSIVKPVFCLKKKTISYDSH